MCKSSEKSLFAVQKSCPIEHLIRPIGSSFFGANCSRTKKCIQCVKALNVSQVLQKDAAWFKKTKYVMGSFHQELPPECPLQERSAALPLRCLKGIVSLSGVNVKWVVSEKSKRVCQLSLDK